MKILLPKTLLEESSEALKLPLFFLAGPIRGGGDWHSRMTKILAEKAGDCIIVNPSRYDDSHPLYQHKYHGTEDAFVSQTMWERHYLQKAALSWPRGCVLFWLAEESKLDPRTDGQPYAMDTRGEIGEWRGRFMHNYSIRLAMGADPYFPGLRTIRRNNEGAVPGRLPIFETMEEVASVAVAHASDSHLEEDHEIPEFLRRLAH